MASTFLKYASDTWTFLTEKVSHYQYLNSRPNDLYGNVATLFKQAYAEYHTYNSGKLSDAIKLLRSAIAMPRILWYICNPLMELMIFIAKGVDYVESYYSKSDNNPSTQPPRRSENFHPNNGPNRVKEDKCK